MNYYKISILGVVLFFASCDDAVDDAACVDSTATVLAASAAYGTDMSYSNCQALKTAALDFANNSCDTTGIGDLSFVIDSLDCNQMACALPLINLIAYGLSMQMATDSATYCMLFDSTMMAADTLLKYNCWGEDSTAYYTAYFDSVEAAGCDPTAKVTLFSATFHEEYDPTVKSFVYISDSLGSVIADTSFYGSGSFVFSKKYTLGSAPEKIGVTAVTLDDGEIVLVTNLGVDIGSDFHYYDPYPDSEVIGQSSYSFINIPSSYYKIMVYSKGNYLRFDTDSESDEYNLNHYYDNEDVLLMLFYEDGTAGYLTLEGVQVGSSHVIDLSTLQTAVHSVITNNTGLDPDYLSAFGYNNGESYISNNRIARFAPGYGLNRMWNDDGNFIINYPSLEVTPNFVVNTFVGSSYQEPGGKNYRQTTTGSLPSSIEKIDADFDVISSDLGNFEISHSGSFDQWSVSLEDTSINAYWNVYNSSVTSTMILPSIPTSVTDEYTSLSNPSFNYSRISLTDWTCAETYKEWIELFHSSDGYYLDFCSGLRDLTYWPPE
jgi:hypothetical protein